MRVCLRRAKRLATILLGLAASEPAGAAVFLVNSLAQDAGGAGNPAACPLIDRNNLPGVLPGDVCTLRDAVAAANFTDGADEIIINLPGTPRITLIAPLVLNDPDGVTINAVPLAGSGGQVLLGLDIEGPLNGDVLQVDAGQTQLRNLRLTRGDVVVADNASVNFEQTTGSATFAQEISGDGSLKKEGGGALVLTGTNAFTGGIEIRLGTLQGDTGSIPGGTDVDPFSVDDDGKLVFDQAAGSDPDDPNFFGEISGTGSLEKIGAGTLFLKTPNSYAGGTTITAGTLIGFAGDGVNGSLQGNIVNNAKLVFEQAANGTFADDISGSGRVEKMGPRDLVLSGSNSFTGGLTISEGRLVGNTDSIPGNVNIATDAEIVFEQNDADGNPIDGTHSGNITGGGGTPPDGFTLIKTGPGILELTGTNTYTGGTLVDQGILQGTTRSLQGPIALNNAGLTFFQGFNGTFNGEIAGAGLIAKGGSGTLTLIDTPTFTALADNILDAGQLVIGVEGQGDGTGTTLPGGLEVRSGATLAGIGGVAGTATVLSGGRISPGGTLDTFRVGSASFASGSTLEVQVSDDDTDLLQAAGNVAITPGAILDVTLTGVAPGADFTQTVLTAGSLTGGPFTDPDDLFFFTLTALQDANSVSIDVTPNADAALPDVAQTRNQRAVATALDEALAAAPDGSDLDAVFSEIVTQTEAEIRDSLDQMAGEQLTEFATTRLAISDRFQTSLQDRIRGVAWSDDEALLARQTRDAGGPVLAADPVLQRALPGLAQGFAPSGAWPIAAAGQQSMSSVLDSATSFQPLQGEHGLGGWIDGYGLFGALDGDSDSSDLDYTIGGFSIGADYLVAKNVLIGAAGGYAYSTLDFDGLSGDATSNTGQGGLYAGYVTPWLRLGASGRFGYSAIETRRDIEFMGRSADGDFSGWDGGGRAEAALDLVRFGFVEVQPLASFTYTHVQQDSFDESGADSLDLDVDEQTIDSEVSGLGARLHGLLQMDEGLWFHPEVHATWTHEFGDRERELDARIGGAPGAVFTVRGAKPAADAGVFGVRWTVVSAGRIHAFADYDVTLSSSLLQQGVSAGVKVVW